MSKNLKISLALVAAAVVAVLAFALTGGDDSESDAEPASSKSERVVRPDSQKLSVAEDGKVTFVEFLDYECEACRAAHPAIEQLRETYDGKVTFVVRNMPLHNNSQRAAQAAEAAAAQGKFEEMYDLLFETQPEWGEQQTPEEQYFFDLAEQIGLDMDEFRSVYDDPATEAKVERDQQDGDSLGVTGTPTFFLDGEQLVPRSYDDFIEAFDEALNR